MHDEIQSRNPELHTDKVGVACGNDEKRETTRRESSTTFSCGLFFVDAANALNFKSRRKRYGRGMRGLWLKSTLLTYILGDFSHVVCVFCRHGMGRVSIWGFYL